MLGWNPLALLGSPLETLMPPDWNPREAHLQTGSLRHADGHFVACEWVWRFVDEGGTLWARDISRQMRFEAELAALVAIARDSNLRNEPEHLLQRIAVNLRPLLAFDELFFSLLENDILRPITPDGEKNGFPPLDRRAWPDHPLWRVIDSGKVWSETAFNIRDFGGAGETNMGFINVPLRVDGHVIGVLHIDSNQPRAWMPDDLRLATLVGEQVALVLLSAQSLAAHQERELHLARTLAIQEAVQEAAAEGICLVDNAGVVISYNRRFAALWEISPVDEAKLQADGQIMAHVLAQLDDPDEFISKVAELFDQPQTSARDEVRLIDRRVFERYSAPVLTTDSQNQKHSFGRVWTFSDISERKSWEERLAHQAWHDAVTGLPNRVLFTQRLAHALERAGRSRRGVGVLFLDLDRFKVVNDSLGHEKGDHLLVQVAARLSSSLRPGDTAARFGGDEFVILLEDIDGAPDATRVADRIAASLQLPFSLDGHEVSVTASIGIVLAGSPDELPEDLLRKADVAMYRAKNSGKAQYQVFSEQLAGAAVERLQLEIDLHGAIKRDELEVFYQPLIDLRTDRIGAWEALVRWHHPTRGLVSPATFIPLAEETGQIVALGTWVLRVACEQNSQWHRNAPSAQKPMLMHVNLSARQFEQRDLAQEIERILKETELSPAQLILEITESAVMTDAKSAILQLEELKKLGVGLSIDDFGTGYSSLAYLEFFPIDGLKIDRTFVKRLDEGTAIVRAITSLGRALDVEVTAEGIETPTQLAQVRELGCHWAQGFLFSKPLPAREAEKLLWAGR